MADHHVTIELLRAVTSGELPPRVLVDVAWNHLMSSCPVCRQEVETWRRAKEQPVDYEAAFRVLPAILERQSRDLEQKTAADARDLCVLLALPQAQRLARIERAVTRFRGAGLVSLLLDEAKRSIPSDPQRVRELAEAARAVLHRSPEQKGATGLAVRAAAYVGNSLRAQGDLRGAQEQLEDARRLLRRHEVTDLLVYAELDWMEGALRKDQRRFRESEELLSRALGLCQVAEEKAMVAPVLLTLGLLYQDWQRYPEALRTLAAVLQQIDPDGEPRLAWYARHNLALTLCELGEHQAAADALKADRELYRRCPDDYTRSRFGWIEGKIAAGLGRLDEAEAAFTATRERFLAQGNGYDAAMVALDLALVYLAQQRTAELKRLAAETVTVFESQAIHREAAAALLLFRQAAERDELTAKAVRELIAYLQVTRLDPGLKLGGR